MIKEYRAKLFRGSKVVDAVELLERLANQSKERAERYASNNLFNDNLSAELHEGMYQGYKDAIDILKAEFGYPQTQKD